MVLLLLAERSSRHPQSPCINTLHDKRAFLMVPLRVLPVMLPGELQRPRTDVIGSRLPWDTLGESKTYLGRIAEGSVKIQDGPSRSTLKLDETDKGPLIIRQRHLQVDSHSALSDSRIFNNAPEVFQINIVYTCEDTRVCRSDEDYTSCNDHVAALLSKVCADYHGTCRKRSLCTKEGKIRC